MTPLLDAGLSPAVPVAGAAGDEVDHIWTSGSLGLSYTYNLDHQRKTLGVTDTSFLITTPAVTQNYVAFPQSHTALN